MSDQETSMEDALVGGSYEVLRARLQAQGRDLVEKVRELNTTRQKTFGESNFTLLGTDRIRTENKCIPVDFHSDSIQ